ncbi:MAG: hypothetical protein IPL40_09325 [Proteobacteria bacterium]|nr:hypothetical protein [Pseudomonadota bacterium]
MTTRTTLAPRPQGRARGNALAARHALARALAPLLLLALMGPAAAFDGPTTHAGLTGEAVLRSGVHQLLRTLGQPQGLFASLGLGPVALAASAGELQRLRVDLSRLDAAEGYRPGDDGVQTALGWITAGSVLAGLPAQLERHHFLDPVTQRGLDQGQWGTSAAAATLATIEGGEQLRALLAGVGFDLSGMAAPAWLRAADNRFSVDALFFHLEGATRARARPAREQHLVLALLALGGVLHLLQDMGSPAHVRNDFAPGMLDRLGGSVFDRGSAFERFVARRYGRVGLQAQADRAARQPTITRPNLRAFFSAADWQGLADLTHARFFSPGTLPRSLPIGLHASAATVHRALSRDLRYAAPALAPIDLGCARARVCYARGPEGAQLAYRVDAHDRLQFWLDDRCHAATARDTLQRVLRYTLGLLAHLLRGALALEPLTSGGVAVRHLGPALGRGQLSWWVEDLEGNRRLLTERTLDRDQRQSGALVDDLSAQQVSALSADPRARRLLAQLSGRDRQGDPLLAVASMPLRPGR